MNLSPRAELPPLGVVGPFFVVAPLGLVLAGIMLLRADDSAFLTPTVQQLIAATHGTVLGWLTLSMMGAMYQLGPATMGGRLRWPGLARAQWVVHVWAVTMFVVAIDSWNVLWMSIAGATVIASFIAFLFNAVYAIRWSLRGSAQQQYFSVALAFLVIAGGVGITYVGDLEHGWFPITLGRIAGHAHLGLAGWLALVVMGASHQLIPMFQLSHKAKPRFAALALWVTAGAALAGSTILMFDPAPWVRVAVAVALAAGPVLWMTDMVWIIQARGRRAHDIQLRATAASLGFLFAAIFLGILAAWGGAIGNVDGPRFQLAYGIVAIGGWVGTTLLGNSFKIVPFLVWFWRYRELAGRQPVPMVGDLTNTHLIHAALAIHILSIPVLAIGALAANLSLFYAGAVILAVSGAVQFGTLAAVILKRPHTSRATATEGAHV